MSTPKVSVIIPVYHTEEYLTRCLESVIQQTLQSIEIIIVVDASPDNSLALIQGYADNDDRIHLINKSVNEGLAAARSSGLKVATAEYVIFLDSDDFWIDSSALSELYMTAQTDQCDILRFNGYRYAQGELTTTPLVSTGDIINGTLLTHEALRVFRSIFLYFFKRQFILDNNLDFIFGQNLGEDGIFTSAALTCSDKVSSINKFYYAYRMNNESMMNSHWTIDKYLEEEASSQLILENLNDCPTAQQQYLYLRLVQYWPRKLAPQAIKLLCKEERDKLYKQACITFSKLKWENIPKNTLRCLIGRKIFVLLTDAKYRELDKYIRLLRPFYWLLDQINKNKYLSLLRPLKNPILRRIRSKLANIMTYKLGFSLYRESFLQRFDKPLDFRNAENIEAYNFRHSKKPKATGISAMLRVKNESNMIAHCIHSIVDVFDEIVVIDNGSTDSTMDILLTLQIQYKATDKIKIFSYPHEIAKCGLDNKHTVENSVHSLAFYYNWCLHQCQYSYVCKWDADMLLSQATGEQTRLRKSFLSMATSPSRQLGSLPVQTAYIDAQGDFYSDATEVNEETRLFPNCPSTYFRKADQWEVLETTYSLPISQVQNSQVYEIKNTKQDEFNHWSEISHFSGRKVKEYRNFRKVYLNFHLLLDHQFTKLDTLFIPQDK